MRWFHLGVIILIATATIVFASQNLEIVTVSFLRFSARIPLAMLIAAVYLLGTVTGGSLLVFLRRSVERSRPHATVSS
jgi:uncharacterized integral membrane protein